MVRFSILVLSIIITLTFIGCNSKPAEDLSPLAKQGRTVYQSQCIACHNTNPKLAGSLGPEVAGSTLELLEARILRAEYPAGYTPKRSTHTMAALPHLKDQIPAIAEYLKSL